MSGDGWIGPRDAWPAHSRPEAQRALKRARDAGFYLKKAKAGAKGWGVLTCRDPAVYAKDARCATYVSSTSGPADGSETAKALDDVRTKCTHDRSAVSGPSSAVDEDALARARIHVERAESALLAAGKLRAEGGHRDLMEDYVKQAESDVEAADSLLAEAIEQEAAAQVAAAEAERAAMASGASVSLGPVGLAERAVAQAGRAEEVLDGLRVGAHALRGRCDAVRTAARDFLP